MFNAERLLGMVMSEVVGSSGGKRGKKRKRGSRGGTIMGSLTSNLATGKGLMTAIGLGVGAYEILKSQQGKQAAAAPIPPAAVPQPPSLPSQSPPPPPPVPGAQPPVPPATPSSPPPETMAEEKSSQNLAIRLIQVMVAAAYADGEMDRSEQQKIFGRLMELDLSPEEKTFILDELHSPKSIVQLTEDITDPQQIQTMYSLAVATVDIDTEAERTWLNEFAKALGISRGMQDFLEEAGN